MPNGRLFAFVSGIVAAGLRECRRGGGVSAFYAICSDNVYVQFSKSVYMVDDTDNLPVCFVSKLGGNLARMPTLQGARRHFD